MFSGIIRKFINNPNDYDQLFLSDEDGVKSENLLLQALNILKTNEVVTSLAINCTLKDFHIFSLVEIIKFNKTLKSLSITFIPSRNNKNSSKKESPSLDDGFIALAKALKENTSLEMLYLANNGITDVGAIALAEALEENIYLKTLCLRNNNITDVGFNALILSPSLTSLNFNSTCDQGELTVETTGEIPDIILP